MKVCCEGLLFAMIGLSPVRMSYCQKGNTLILTILMLGIVMIVMIILFIVYSLFFVQQRQQDRSEKIAMTAARITNYGDRAGQMNNMVALSRQLVFNSRNAYHETAQYPNLDSFASHLLEESREGAQEVDQARKQLTQLTIADLCDLTKNTNKPGGGDFGWVNLGWVMTEAPAIKQLELGCVKNVDSNVAAPESNRELWQADTSQNYINPVSNLYYGNMLLSLPEDKDLTFKISSLPAPVNGTVSPARLTSDADFKSTMRLVENGEFNFGSCEYLPSAVRLNSSVNVENFFDRQSRHTLAVSTTAAANGASPRP